MAQWARPWLLICLLSGLAAPACGGSTPTSPSPTVPAPPAPPATTLSLACGSDIATVATDAAGAAVAFPLPAVSGATNAMVSCLPASGSTFTIGNSEVRCTASTPSGQTASCSFTVRVSPPPARLLRTRFLAFGDSLTSGEVTVPVAGARRDPGDLGAFRLIVVPQASYPAQTQSILRARYAQQASAIVMTNAGISGEWAADGAKRFASVMSSSRPEAVVLLEGANDLAALGTSGISSASAAIESMAKDARLRGARVVIANLPPSRPGGRGALPTSLLLAFNSRLQAIARGEGALFVDLYSALSGNVSTYIGVDGLHPTEAGYLRMGEVVADALRADLEVQ